MSPAVLFFVGLLVFSPVVVVSVGAEVGIAEEEDKAESSTLGPQNIFSAIETAWTAGDAAVLAALVQIDGIQVTMGGSFERTTEYSPSQSLYFFKNLFQTRDTLEFQFTRLQNITTGERAHGMAAWRYRSSGTSRDQELRLVFLLTRQDDVWRLSEINKITVR